MEVSNEIKEDIRKTQTDLKNAIRIHQVWVARLHEDQNNSQLKSKVQDAEKEIVDISQKQKRVLDRLRRELELYQQRLRARNKHVNIENDNRYVAQQLRDHQIQYYQRNKSVSLIKQSVLTEIKIKAENVNGDIQDNKSYDSKYSTLVLEKDESSQSEVGDNVSVVTSSRNNFTNALNKVKESFMSPKVSQSDEWQENERRSGSEGSPPQQMELSPSPSPPPMPQEGEYITQEVFLRLVGLVTPQQKELMIKKRTERRKRSTTSTNKKDFLYENYESGMKRKKLNQFQYLPSHTEPPQTRSAKLKKQQKSDKDKSSREGSPSGSSSETKERDRDSTGEKERVWVGEGDRDSIEKDKVWGKPSWAASLPPGLSVEPVYNKDKKPCYVCGRNEPRSSVWRCKCGVRVHSMCATRCPRCGRTPRDPHSPHSPTSPHSPKTAQDTHQEKISERKRLQERNIQLCYELRKLEARAAALKENLDEHQSEKRQLLSEQIKTQRNLQKLLDFIGQFKDTSISLQSTSISESSSEISKSNEE